MEIPPSSDLGTGRETEYHSSSLLALASALVWLDRLGRGVQASSAKKAWDRSCRSEGHIAAAAAASRSWQTWSMRRSSVASECAEVQ